MITEAQLKTVLSENLSPEEVDIFLEKRPKTLYAKGNIDNINEIIKVLKKYNLLFLLNKCTAILVQGKSKNISTILDILEKNNLLDLVSKCPRILAQGNGKSISSILDILEENNLKDLVSQCPYILARGNSKEIINILNVLEEKNQLELLNTCPTILAQGNGKNISAILDILEKNNLKDLVKKCPGILARGNSKEIINILNVLEEKRLTDLVSKCPSILAKGNSKKISAILDILEKNNLKELVSQCPYILARGNSKEIKLVLSKIKKINGNVKELSPNLLINYSKLCNIIDLNKGNLSNKEYYKNIRFYLLLTDKYNQIYTKEELIDLASLLNISYDTLLSAVCHVDNKLANTILEKQNYLWIGNNIPIRKEDFTFYQNQILDIINLVTQSFLKEHSFFKYEDVYDFVLDSLMNKCGAFFINFGKTEKLRPFLFQYLKLTCKGLLGSTKAVEFEKINNLQEYSYQEDNEVNQFIQNYFYLSAEEQYFLLEMSKGIEGGYDYIEYLMEKFFLTKKEVIEKITNIREKIASHNNGLEDDSYQKTI